MLPDIELPSSVDVTKVGESARETALPWDEIRATGYDLFGNTDTGFVSSLQNRHSKRASVDPDFRHLLDTIKEISADENRSVSLNKEVREQERQAELDERLARENSRRAGLGLEPLETTKELDEVEAVDVLLHETAEIVADMVTGPVIARRDETSELIETN